MLHFCFTKDLASLAVVSKLEIKWWGQSRSRNFHVDIDQKRIINYNETVKPTLNGWTKFDNIDTSGSSIQLTLTDGVQDCWKMNKKLGIRQIRIYGRYVDEPDTSLRTVLFSQFSDYLDDPATVLMVKFLENSYL